MTLAMKGNLPQARAEALGRLHQYMRPGSSCSPHPSAVTASISPDRAQSMQRGLSSYASPMVRSIRFDS
jgi:hypothetical protein